MACNGDLLPTAEAQSSSSEVHGPFRPALLLRRHSKRRPRAAPAAVSTMLPHHLQQLAGGSATRCAVADTPGFVSPGPARLETRYSSSESIKFPSVLQDDDL
jgi:hypothetical protein